jgi:hypothetical protein
MPPNFAGKEIKDQTNISIKATMGTTQDKTKVKEGDGLPTIAIEDTKDSDKATIPHRESPSPKTQTMSKAKVNGRRMAKENNAVAKEKERDEVKENRIQDHEQTLPRKKLKQQTTVNVCTSLHQRMKEMTIPPSSSPRT